MQMRTTNNCLRKAKIGCIHHTDITEDHLNAYSLHTNGYGKRVFAKKLISRSQAM